MKKILSIALIIVFIFASFTTNFAQSSSNDQTKIIELMANGLNRQEAEQIAKVDRIAKEAEKNGQTFELVNGNIEVINTKDTKESISKDDEKYLKDLLKKSLVHKVKSSEEKKKDMDGYISKNPGRTKYRLTYEDGSWVEVIRTITREDIITDTNVNTYFDNVQVPNEVERGTAYTFPSDGTYTDDYTWREYTGSSYSYNELRWSYTVSNNGYHIHANNCVGAANGSGIIGVSNQTYMISVSDTDYYGQPTLWCEAQQDAIFNFSGSIGIALSGTAAFNFSVSAGKTWNQYTVFRASLTQEHYYNGYRN